MEQLRIGDCSRSKTFKLLTTTDTGEMTTTFSAARGEEFVVLLLGMAKKGVRADVDKMVAQMGLVASDGGAEEILHLKGVIADLEAQLAAKG
jgi:hypothetical protein